MAENTEQLKSAGAVGSTRLVRAPDWILKDRKITQRQWRIRKRRELKAIIAAAGKYRMGCAYCPGTNAAMGRLVALLQEMWESHKEKNWPWRPNEKVER